MRCKKHFSDLSGTVGVCASCLRERLFALIAAQAQSHTALEENQRRKNETLQHQHQHQHPLVFPRSVSPYISRRKSDNQRFYSTPQLGPNGSLHALVQEKKKSKFSIISNLFRSKSEHVGNNNSNNKLSSPWYSILVSRKNKDNTRLANFRRPVGMSPEGVSDEERSSGESSEWKETPTRRPPRGGRVGHARNLSGMAFCLSPLVRASPNRRMQPEMTMSGEIRVPGKPHISAAASYCANRSRKLADFGRFNPNR